jgi:transposase
MKGYVRTPSTKIIERLKSYEKVRVKEVDEFRSTMICSKCDNPMNISKSPHRFASCPSCKRVWNRDINAAINIKLCVVYKFDTYSSYTDEERRVRD